MDISTNNIRNYFLPRCLMDSESILFLFSKSQMVRVASVVNTIMVFSCTNSCDDLPCSFRGGNNISPENIMTFVLHAETK